MFKSTLQELCQKRSWPLPEYFTVKDGSDHAPLFTATVNVRGQAFETPGQCKSSKEAQNTAARIAFNHFSIAPPTAANHLPLSIPALATVDSQFHGISRDASLPVDTSVAPPREMRPIAKVCPQLPLSPLPSPLQNSPPDKLHIYKNQLQQYAQKENLDFPVYTTEAEGPRFKSRVSIGGKLYENLDSFPTLKEAEQAAAKVACHALSVNIIQEGGGLYKNLLQEFSQKNGFLCPSYVTSNSGMFHGPTFVSTVVVGTGAYRGEEAKTKKHAEMNAAKVAYSALTNDNLHIYKNLLQQYAQIENIGFPVYINEAKRPRFKSRVSVGGKSYGSLEFFPAAKEAEQAAAKVACQALSIDVFQEGGGLYRTLLQEFAQKQGFLCPSYATDTSGMSHMPAFLSIVIGTDTFRGDEAKTKKLAEMNSAKIAYCALTNGYAAIDADQCHVADNSSQNIQPTTTIKKDHKTTNEEPQAKRAKSSPKCIKVESDLGHPSQDYVLPSDGLNLLNSQVENPISDELLIKQTVEKLSFLQWKTMVVPCKANLPIP